MTRALVTGAGRGLGFALVSAFLERGDDVIAVCRTTNAGLDALGAHVIEGVDVSQSDAVSILRQGLGPEPIDIVVCNAGVNKSYASSIEELDVDVLKAEFEVNTFGVVRTIQAVLPNLREGAKIGLISTWRPGVGAARRNYGYQMSKVATNQLGFLIADDLRERGIATIILSPGPMDTELLREVVESGHANLRPGQAQDPLDVARDLLARLDELTPETSGSWRFRAGDDMGAIATSAVYGH
jgi:NAD(P)-dependent dehydrogenase (short-subunit alcohol dehydrogenase family)